MFLKKGFTLVELMIVIAIIGILSIVLFPSMTRYLASSRDVNRMTDIRHIADVFQTYRTVNEILPDNSTGATWSYCVNEIIRWPNAVATSKDRQYEELGGNIKVAPFDKSMTIPTYPCSQTGSYMYNRLPDPSGTTRYGIFAARMETNNNVTYLTGFDFVDSLKISTIMQAEKIKGLDLLTLPGTQEPLYHAIIY